MLRTRFWGLAFVGTALAAMLLAACSGDDDDGTAAPAATTPGGSSSCESIPPPPTTGEGPDDLEGTITYTRFVAGCDADIFAVDANGDNARAVIDDPTYDDEADLSPDGTKIVFFISPSVDENIIYTANLDGSHVTQLTAGGSLDISPRWSPDGSQIAYGASGNIVVMNADGSDKQTVFEALPQSSREPCHVSATVGDWSPDGGRILYYSTILSGDGNMFWVCSLDLGGDIEILVSDPVGGLHAEPHWSPDGTKIVYRDDRDSIEQCNLRAAGDCNYEIYVMDLATGVETNISNNPAYDIEPVWSPDGEWIVFASARDDPNFDLYVMRPDGSDVQRILADPASKDSYPSWQ